MIEFKHSDPRAFGAKWEPLPKFLQARDDFDFRYYKYRIFGVVYEKDNAEFRAAYEKAQVWKKIKE